MNKNISTIILMLVIMCVCFTSCGLENLRYNYSLEVTFEMNDDVSVFEERLKIFDVNINEVKNENQKYLYNVSALNTNDDGLFGLLNTNYEFSSLNLDGVKVIDRGDVVFLKMTNTTLDVTVSQEYFDYFYDNFLARTIIFVIDGVEYRIDATLEDNTISFIHAHGDYTCLKKAAIALGTDDLKGEVTLRAERSEYKS